MSYRRRKREFQHEEAHAEEAAPHTPPLEHPEVPAGKPRMVSSPEELDDLIHTLREAGSVAFDTEFIGEETYHPRICLIQLATTELTAIIDPFVIDDLNPVWELIADSEVETIVHAGNVDLMHVRRAINTEPGLVVDTQVAAAFAGLPWPVGLARVIESFTGRRLGKGHTFTNWDARPLSTQQLRYAADDVRYLPMLWSLLRKDLEQRGTLDWALTECKNRLIGESGFDPDAQSRRASKGMRLKPRAQALLRALVCERDRIAEQEDRPHRVVLPDGALLEIIRRRPESKSDLAAIRGLPRPTAERWFTDILEIVANAEQLELPSRPYVGLQGETAPEQVAVDALWMVVSTRLLALGISPGMVISRAALANWFLGNQRGENRSLFTPDDWRWQALGAWLEAFLAGERRLSVAWGKSGAVVAEEGTYHDGSGVHGNPEDVSSESS